MEPISLILAALAAGATGAAKDTAGTAVKDAYESLKALIKKKWFFRTYTVENSPSSLSVQQCSKVDKYQSSKNSKPYCTSFTSMSC
ncbi:exported hypothetical protein [Microcystis aeruginosa PCC 9807]|uniref:Uncharacterized protein n=1 Tax=Microcystis aeruginosa PCC 9807 TaxID=1160283 RepID=I4H6B6_MICAE|nr:hypothetical protein [Microcystis aeruginosa]CCI17590.1 exported hypothetical protein [Microcystis aeruginosa PCC 9807]